MQKKINQAVKALREGGIIAYPTEGVFGLGCDPFNETAVKRLLKIKGRKAEKGLILIASSWSQARGLIKNQSSLRAIGEAIQDKNPTTWIFPATKKVPSWVCGKFNSVAIRVTLHPIAKNICQKFGGPIISTSANLVAEAPAKNTKQVREQFSAIIDLIVSGRVGALKKTTQIRDAKANKLIRS
jgi:L-threonylcarbamoyladenylate synthase